MRYADLAFLKGRIITVDSGGTLAESVAVKWGKIVRVGDGGQIEALIGPNQAVDVMEAIRTYTINGAYASFDEERLGSIEEGKLADIIVLSDDITTVEDERIKDVEVLATIVDGKLIYGEL